MENTKDTKDTSDFKSTLKFLRQENKLTQSGLGSAIGYGYTAISNYESGKTEPGMEDLIKLADFFGVSVDFLVGRRGGQKEQTKYELELQAKRVRGVIDEMLESLDKTLYGTER